VGLHTSATSHPNYRTNPTTASAHNAGSAYYVDTGLIAGNVYLFAGAQGLAAWFHHCDKTGLTPRLNCTGLCPTQCGSVVPALRQKPRKRHSHFLATCLRIGHGLSRHCPRCQANARLGWLQARERELLPTRYVHLVFTLPRELAPLALQNKRLIYNLLFRASAATLLEIARDPRHLGAEIGFFSVLHTWNQRLQFHPHVHCVAAAGGLAPDHTHWIPSRPSFFLPVKVLSRVFRGKFVAGLKTAFHQDKLARLPTGTVPSAEAPCTSSNGSPQLNSLHVRKRWKSRGDSHFLSRRRQR
jgi:hypothetical protein